LAKFQLSVDVQHRAVGKGEKKTFLRSHNKVTFRRYVINTMKRKSGSYQFYNLIFFHLSTSPCLSFFLSFFIYFSLSLSLSLSLSIYLSISLYLSIPFSRYSMSVVFQNLNNLFPSFFLAIFRSINLLQSARDRLPTWNLWKSWIFTTTKSAASIETASRVSKD